MDTFVCSSWYYLRYPDALNENEPFSSKSNNWLPVDYYIGGAEHATMHLLYAIITKALYDMKFVSFKEPFLRFFSINICFKVEKFFRNHLSNRISLSSSFILKIFFKSIFY